MKIGCYARVSTQDQQTLALQRDAVAAYAQQRGWSIVTTITEVGSGVRERQQRDQLMRAARRREIDAIVVWRLDRWGRSVVDLVSTLHELHALGVGFISLHEALDFTTPTGRAMAGLLAIFAQFEREILRERVKAGIAQAVAMANGMAGRRVLPTARLTCSGSQPQASVSRPSLASWASVGPRSGASSLPLKQRACDRPMGENLR
jgi:putative DNA-invertase from lambdoid prophage Rac